VFEVLLEAWTLRCKTEQKGLNRIRNVSLRIAESNLASRRIDMHRPLFQREKEQSETHRLAPRSSTVPPNDPKYEDGGSPSSSAISTNIAERSSTTQSVKTINTIWRGFCGDLKKGVHLPQLKIQKPPMCFWLAREGGHETQTTRLMA
ncbi:hypothetical protein H5410_046791, partial [Solanum commersonii]